MISPVLFAVRGRPNSELSLTLVTQSPDVSDDNKIPSCFDLPVVPHKSVCLPSFFLLLSFSIPCVCFFCLGGAEGPGSFLLYLFGQESFVPLGLRWPPLCLLSKPVARMKYKYCTWKKQFKWICVCETHLLPMTEQVLSILLRLQ